MGRQSKARAQSVACFDAGSGNFQLCRLQFGHCGPISACHVKQNGEVMLSFPLSKVTCRKPEIEKNSGWGKREQKHRNVKPEYQARGCTMWNSNGHIIGTGTGQEIREGGF